ncbi:MAG: helix-turn-helix domain-containing protein [Sciscionella sp.]
MDVDEQLARRIGARVRAQRQVNRQKQIVVAELAGITADYLYQVERGKKLPTVAVLTELAKILRVPVGALLDEQPEPTHRSRATETTEAVYRSLTGPLEDAEPMPASELRERIGSAWRIWQTAPQRYSAITPLLPDLVSSARLAESAVAGTRRDVARCAVSLYALLRTVLKRFGRLDLALLAADRGMRAAAFAEDERWLAVARWNLAHVLLADNRSEHACEVARTAAADLRGLVAGGDRAASALSGSANLLGAVANVRRGELWAAHQHLREAAVLAARTGECNVGWTAFGPTNVAMHAVNIEAGAGEFTEALRLAERVEFSEAPSIERRAAFLVDQASAYLHQRDHAGALCVLRDLHRAAPEDIAERPAAREALHTVVQRGRRSVAQDAARLAAGAGIPLS